MAIDATGTPTSLGIPKFNTAVDAPSGKGGNAQMDAIDTLIASGPTKPTGIISGETIVYNGATFDRSSVTKLGLNSINITGTPNGTKFLRDDGSWQLVSTGPTITYATTPPGTPADGDIWYYVDSTTLPTVQWTFRFHSGSSNTDKWEFVGGPPLFSEVTGGTFNSATYVDPSVVATLTVPRAGVYKVSYYVRVTPSAGGTAHVAAKKGAAATADADSINPTAIVNGLSGFRKQTVTGLAASDVVKLQARTLAAAAATVDFAGLEIIPVRVS